MDTTLIGIAICFVGSFLGALGDKLVHDSYGKEKAQRKHMSQMTMWLFGTLLSVVIDPILTICSLYFTSAALVAPFAGVHILWNLIITNISLKIRTKLHQYMGSFFLICGIALIIIFSEKKVDIHSMNDLASLYSQTKVIIYLVLAFTIIVTLLIVCLLPFLFKDVKNASFKSDQLLYMSKFVPNACTRSCEISLCKKIDTNMKFSGGATSCKTGMGVPPEKDPLKHPISYPMNGADDPLPVVSSSAGGNTCGGSPNANERRRSSPTGNERSVDTSTEGDNSAPRSNDGIILASEREQFRVRRNTKVGEKTSNGSRRNALINYRPGASLPCPPANRTLSRHPTERIKKISFKSSRMERRRPPLQLRKGSRSWDAQKGGVERALDGKSPPVNRGNPNMAGTKCTERVESRDDLYCSGSTPHPGGKKDNNVGYQGGSHTTSCSNLEPKIEPTPNDGAEPTSTHKKKKKKKKNFLLSPYQSVKMIKKFLQNKGRAGLKVCKKKKKSFLRYISGHKQNGPTGEDPPERSPQSSHPNSIAGNEPFCPIDILKCADKINSCENWKDEEPFSLKVYSPTRDRGSVGSSPANAGGGTAREGKGRNDSGGSGPIGPSRSIGSIARSDPAQLQYLVLIASIYPAAAKKSKIRHPEIFYRICCCTLCGMSGGFVNIFSEQIIGIFSKEKLQMFTHPFAYVLMMLTLFCLCNQLFFLNISLSKFSVTSVIPLIMANLVFFSSLTTIIMREEESVIQSTNAVCFSLGVLLVIIGILYLQYNINRVLLRCFKPKKG
ncbi:unnamed protein product [Plasmodium vivax]|uniref:Magnesium transporter n=3 Tax=Plasmodium vivax TaxID=5855 RepID=A0A0J9THB4_PLAVI|nr:hypothetical protein PVIIG_03812 [Plasmodium vivax India VII]KMZ94406.1 hypothetical protein PVMG_01764 [Plasmodium vivax Mauritania I]CAG9479667.1 unnamed protein product [Plasmodium vivax]